MEVLKSPLRHDLSRYDEETVTHMREEESFSSAGIDREKLTYGLLPKHDHILDYLVITETGIRLPYMQHGNLREYIRKNPAQLSGQIRET
jgi:hypothetical protein